MALAGVDDADLEADRLLLEFGSLPAILAARLSRLQRHVGEPATADALRIIARAMGYAARARIASRRSLKNWRALEEYLRVGSAFSHIESVRVIYLSVRNTVLLDEVASEGSIDHAQIYVREIVARALEVGSTALILVHNHPAGDPTPSHSDIAITRALIDAGKPLGVGVHDHLIVAAAGNVSLRARGLI